MRCFKSRIVLFFVVIFVHVNDAASTGKAEIAYTFTSVEYDWPTDTVKASAINNGKYIVENNIISGIKIYGDSVYVTVPRWKLGVPATLNQLVTRDSNTTVLQPFPSWSMNSIGDCGSLQYDCGSLQYVQSMEVDPNTGYMWIIDTGRINTKAPPPMSPINLCPAKIIVLNIEKKEVIRKYVFPPSIVSPTSNFLNDIVLDYVDGKASYAYMTDASDAKIYVYDYDRNISYYFQHDSMKRQPLIPGVQDGLFSDAVDGIAISSDFSYVYYSSLASLQLYAIPTDVLHRKDSVFSKSLVFVGNKTGGSDGMAFGQISIFYGALEQNAMYSAKEAPNEIISLSNQRRLVADDNSVVWVDSFAWNGTDLWFTANKLNRFFSGKMNFSGSANNMLIWKMDVGEKGYLDDANLKTNISAVASSFKTVLIACVIVLMLGIVLKHRD